MATYKCFKSDFKDLTKKINRITKKLDKYGYKWHFEVIGESIEKVNIIDYTNYDNIPAWQFTPKNMGKIAVDVVTYEFSMDRLQLGSFEVIAVLEHRENGNLIHIIKEETSIPDKYRTTSSICDHCNSNRMRNKTVLLQDNSGSIKQVGTTCIKEYTGIDAVDIIAAYQEIHDIIIDNNNLDIDSEYSGRYPQYKNTIDYLTACIQLITEEGYDKETTKYKAWDMTRNNEYNNQYKEIAEKVRLYFAEHDFTDNFLNNIKVVLSSDFCKVSGFIAYAYIAYQKQLELEAKKEAEEEQKALSQYVGKVKDKIQKELTYINHFSYEVNYSYYPSTSHIHLFKDEDGNVYKWTTNKPLAIEVEQKDGSIDYKHYNIGDKVTLKGTVKAHEEYKGTKQTVLTRCKVL